MSGGKRTVNDGAAVGVNDGIDGDHAGGNGLGLAVNVSKDAIGVEDGGSRRECLNLLASGIALPI